MPDETKLILTEEGEQLLNELDEEQQRLVDAWNELQQVPSYVETQAKLFANEK